MRKRELSRPGIYAIVNTVNGRTYVGSSADIYKRWSSHRHQLSVGTHPNGILLAAWRKYGPEAFVWHVLEFCERETLLPREQHWIDLLGTVKGERGYNILPLAQSNLGLRHSDETRARLREIAKARVHTPESRAKRAAALRGRKVAPEVLARRGTRRGIVHTPEQRQLISGRRSRVSAEAVSRIQALLADGVLTYAEIASEVGVRRNYVAIVKTGRLLRTRVDADANRPAP